MTFIKYIIGSAATIMVVYSAARLITAGGDEEKVSTHKAGIMYSAGGLILIYIGDIFINKVFYKIDKIMVVVFFYTINKFFYAII